MPHVEVWVRNDLHRMPGREPRYERRAEWDDPRPGGALEIAERTWKFLAYGESAITPDDRGFRHQWEAVRNGFGFGVGDVLVIDGVALRCEAVGFSIVDLRSVHP